MGAQRSPVVAGMFVVLFLKVFAACENFLDTDQPQRRDGRRAVRPQVFLCVQRVSAGRKPPSFAASPWRVFRGPNSIVSVKPLRARAAGVARDGGISTSSCPLNEAGRCRKASFNSIQFRRFAFAGLPQASWLEAILSAAATPLCALRVGGGLLLVRAANLFVLNLPLWPTSF